MPLSYGKRTDSRPVWRTWSFWAFMVGFIASFVTLMAALGEQLHEEGSQNSFWVAVRQPGSIAIYFACFFGFAVFISLLAHTILAFEEDVRWLAFMGTLLTTVYIIALSLSGVGLLNSNVFIAETLSLSGFIMIFALIASCGRCSPVWLILQIITFLAFVIAFGAGSATFRSSGGEITALFGPPWAQAIYYVYYSLGGIYRFCALVECKNKCASNLIEEISYWVLIILNTGMYFAVFAVKPIFLQQSANSLDNATLLLDMSTLVQYSVTPLLLVHFEALSHAQARSLMLRVQQANNQLAVAQSAAQARREFIRYVFHEVRVPFNTIVLGLDELRATASSLGHRQMIGDLKLMQTAADGMQQILNDTLTFEKMSSGTYALEMKPTNIAETLQTVFHSMQPWAREKNIRIGLEILPGVPEWVVTDPNRISQVLANFLSNALKFVDQSGNGVIQVQAFPIDQPSPTAAGEECCATDLPSDAVQIPVGNGTAAQPATTQYNAEPLPHVALLQWFRDVGTRFASVCGYPRQDAAPSPTELSPQGDIPSGSPSAHESLAIEEKLSLPAPLHLRPYRHAKKRRATATSVSTIRNDTQVANDDTAMSVSPTEAVDLSAGDTEAQGSARPASLVTPSVSAQTMNRVSATVWVRFQVIDNGIGISQDALQRLWQPFFQIDAGATQQGRGSGLGLSICKEIIRHHGGRVGVRSRPNAGSTFFAEIPFVVCRKPSSDSMGSTATPGKSSIGTPGRGGDAGSAQGIPTTTALTQVHIVDHLVMLIVDDVASNRLFLRRSLKRHLPKCEVFEAADGAAAVELIRQNPGKFNVICMDKQMPIMDGFQATKEILALGYSGVIVGVTANALSTDVQEFMQQGVHGVVTKPVNVAQLLDVIEMNVSISPHLVLPAGAGGRTPDV